MSDQTVADTASHLTIAQVARALNIHPETARRLLRKTRLRGIKVGSRWRVPAQELARVEKQGGV
ncbi:MAG: helix-turn-helix domain-containing protein [Limisphaerales bacterium]